MADAPSVEDLLRVEEQAKSGTVIPPEGGDRVQSKTLVGKAVLCPDCATTDLPQTARVVDGGWSCLACGSTGTAMELLGNPKAVLRAGTSGDDDAGMPWILPAGGGKPVRYSRASSFAKPLENSYMLHRRDQRAQAVGIHYAPELILKTEGVVNDRRIDAITDAEDRAAIDHVVSVSMRLGGVWDKADRGTLLHSIGEHRDMGRPVPQSVATPEVLAQYEPWLAARDACLQAYGFVWLARELTVVNDDLQASGALDGLAVVRLPHDDRVPERLRGELAVVVVDDKYGQVRFALLSYTAQQAIYAGGKVYNPGTGSRVSLADFVARRLVELGYVHDGHKVVHPDGSPAPEFTDEVAVILDTPLDDEPVTHFVPVPLDHGRRCAELAVAIRAERSASSRWLDPASSHRATADGPAEVASAAGPEVPAAPPVVVTPADPLTELIMTGESAEWLRALYTANASVWTPQHTEAAQARITLLGAGLTAA